jgi:predicted phosphodiesterase
MKLMFASDIHGSLPATERVLSLFAQSGAQWLIILGDVLNHGPRNALPEGYALRRSRKSSTRMPRASSPFAATATAKWTRCCCIFPLPRRGSRCCWNNSRLFLTHGHLFSPDNLPALAAGDVLVYGHTHIPVAEKRGEIYHFNPGSVSIPKAGILRATACWMEIP